MIVLIVVNLFYVKMSTFSHGSMIDLIVYSLKIPGFATIIKWFI